MDSQWPGGLLLIQTFSDGTFQRDDDGGREAVMIGTDQTPSDAVAWFDDDPARWWLHRGLAAFLNPEEIDRAIHFQEPLRIFATPADWLDGRGRGVVVLDWTAHVSFWLAGADRLLVDDAETGQRLEAAFRREVPQIRLAQEAAHAA